MLLLIEYWFIRFTNYYILFFIYSLNFFGKSKGIFGSLYNSYSIGLVEAVSWIFLFFTFKILWMIITTFFYYFSLFVSLTYYYTLMAVKKQPPVYQVAVFLTAINWNLL